MKQIIEFENNDYILTIDGNDYAVAKRTGELETQLREHDKKLGDLSEYESNKELVELILGKKAFKEIFPKGEKESLDKLAKVAYYCVKYFNADKEAIDKQRMEERAKDLNEIAKPLAEATKIAETVKQYEHLNK